MAQGRVEVRGLKELSRAFKFMDKELRKELKGELKAVGEPVRHLAEQKAITSIRNITTDWAAMRLGLTSKVGYVAPKMRPRGGSPRPKFGTLLMDRAMAPALQQSEPHTIARFEEMLDRIADRAGF